MKAAVKQFKKISLTTACLFVWLPLFAQVKPPASSPVKHHHSSQQLKDFFTFAAQANAIFVYPKGFREIPAPDDEDFSYDYALELPGKGFEIWLKVTSQKEEWFNYTRTQTVKGPGMENPDSVYLDVGKADARMYWPATTPMPENHT
jgi:hypothetical protein